MFGWTDQRKLMTDIFVTIARYSEDGIIIINQRHNIVFYNDSARRMFGYMPEEVIGQSLNMLLPERFRLQHDVLVDDFGAGREDVRHMSARSREVRGQRKDGTEFTANTTIVKTGSGRSRFYAAIIRDISEQEKAEGELLRLATTDPLTGVLNRREFTALAEQEALRSRRYGRPLSIMIMDIDHFKKLNDTYGHAAGDKALQRFSSICCNALRNIDVFGRWGGEEFVALLPETTVEQAEVIAERLRRLVSENVLTYEEHKISLTVSIGLAQYRDGESGIEEPLARADAAVYDAKKAGRNRVSVARN